MPQQEEGAQWDARYNGQMEARLDLQQNCQRVTEQLLEQSLPHVVGGPPLAHGSAEVYTPVTSLDQIADFVSPLTPPFFQHRGGMQTFAAAGFGADAPSDCR